MNTVDGFKIFNLKFSESSKTSSQLFFKPHNIRSTHDRKPSDRTLFILNIPSYITKDALSNVMSEFGAVKEIFFHSNPTSNVTPESKFPMLNPDEQIKGYKVGYVVFRKKGTLEKVMAHPSDTPFVASTEEKPIVTGMKKWYAEYNSKFVSSEKLHEEAEAVMKDYDERKAREKEAKSQEPDEDGWITVTSKKRTAPTQEGNTKGSKRRRKRKAQILNFYSFQQKETNMKHLEERKKKFEEDGKRMTMLRKSRKFKPL